MNLKPSLAMREAGTSQPVHRASRRRPSASHLLIALAVILAFVLNLLALQGRGETVLVAIADREIPAGATLESDMVRYVPIDSGFDGVGSMLTQQGVSARLGWVVQRAVPIDGLLDVSSLAEPAAASGLRSMSLPLPLTRAAGGTVVVGDRIDVISVTDGVADFVALSLEVLAVPQVSSGFSSVDHHLVVAVTAEQALALAEAMAAGPIDVVRSTGAPEFVGGQEDGEVEDER